LEITIDLLGCIMADASTTFCEGGEFPSDVIPPGDPLWVGFSIGGQPMAHFVTEVQATWQVQFAFDSNVSAAGQNQLTVTDMAQAVLAGIAPAELLLCDVFGECVYRFDLDPLTYVHGLHILPFVSPFNAVSLTRLRIETSTGNIQDGNFAYVEHFKGLWEQNVIPEPATVFLMGLGLVGLGFARRRRLNKP
jgi:hypothetical protein